jgi:SepF-like predicted cell division protein (DUF552 family)
MKKKRLIKKKAKNIIFVIAGSIILASSIFLYLVNNTTKESSRKIYEEVLSYDYTKGRDEKIERLLDNLSEMPDDSGTEKTFYNFLAKAIYYYRVKQYTKSTEALKIAEQHAEEDPEKIFKVLTLYYDVYSEVKNKKKMQYYGRILAGDFSELYSEEELEEIRESIQEENESYCE